MEILLGIGIAILGIFLVTAIKLSTTLFHELGHAIPALIFTKKKVDVYVGSYGDLSKSIKINLRRLHIYLRWNIFDWKIGMCRQEEPVTSYWKNVIILFGGPIASLLISIPLILNYETIESNSLLTFITLVFIASSIYDFFINMVPFSSPIKMHDGAIAYCDGYALYSLTQRKFAPKVYFAFEKMYLEKKYEEIIDLGTEQIKENTKQRFVYDFVIEAMINLDMHDEALDIYFELNNNLNLKEIDYYEIGKIYKNLGNYSEALDYLNHYRYKNYSDPNLLNEIASLHLKLGQNKEALKTLNALLSIDQLHLSGYLSRSLALIRLNEFDLALLDLQFVKRADQNNPQLYFNLGLIDEQLNKDEEALINYKKAKELKFEHHGLDYKIETLETALRAQLNNKTTY